jgi:hypothetical protein
MLNIKQLRNYLKDFPNQNNRQLMSTHTLQLL